MAAKWSKTALCRFAAEVRRVDLGLTEFEPLCPYDLATEHGIEVYDVTGLERAGCSPATIEFFSVHRPEVWSAALVPNGTGCFIVENSVHTLRRRRSNVAHEMSHALLEHEFDKILFADNRGRCHNPTTKQMEREATELSGELLLPAAGARRAACTNLTDEEVADAFDVSIEFARWRLNVTGARTIAQRAATKRGRRLTHQ